MDSEPPASCEALGAKFVTTEQALALVRHKKS